MAVSSLFESKGAKAAVGVVTGVLAIGAEIVNGMANSAVIESEMNRILSCMEKNVEYIKTNLKYVNAAREKIEGMLTVRKVNLGYINSINNSLENDLHYIIPHNKCEASADIVEIMYRICESFEKISNRQYVKAIE